MTPRQRLVELDVLRGFSVAVMILVTCPGSWAFTYPQLQHAGWHGWTFADFVFPDFLFGVGMALGLAYGNSLNPHSDPRAFWLKVARRVFGLIALGLTLNAVYLLSWRLGAEPVGPEGHDGLRIPGVLQRIALVYLIALAVLRLSSRRTENARIRILPSILVASIALCLLGYWLLLTLIPVPGFDPGDLTIAGNLPGYVDRLVFGTQHMWALGSESWRGPIFYDPEGLLSTIPASVNVLFGVLAVNIWQGGSSRRIPILACMGLALVVAGLLLDPVFPINKKLWTSSFALLTSGLSFLAFLTAAALVRAPSRILVAPLKMLGGNAIVAFSISVVLSAMASVPLATSSGAKPLQQLGFELFSSQISDPYVASLGYAVSALALVALLILPLDRKGIHVRL